MRCSCASCGSRPNFPKNLPVQKYPLTGAQSSRHLSAFGDKPVKTLSQKQKGEKSTDSMLEKRSTAHDKVGLETQKHAKTRREWLVDTPKWVGNAPKSRNTNEKPRKRKRNLLQNQTAFALRVAANNQITTLSTSTKPLSQLPSKKHTPPSPLILFTEQQ